MTRSITAEIVTKLRKLKENAKCLVFHKQNGEKAIFSKSPTECGCHGIEVLSNGYKNGILSEYGVVVFKKI